VEPAPLAFCPAAALHAAEANTAETAAAAISSRRGLADFVADIEDPFERVGEPAAAGPLEHDVLAEPAAGLPV
jgi:hypothetical protein